MGALAAEVASGSLEALTLGFHEYTGAALDETPLAEQVAKRYGLRHQVRWITRQDFTGALGPRLEAIDQLSIDSVNTYFVARAARERNCKYRIGGSR